MQKQRCQYILPDRRSVTSRCVFPFYSVLIYNIRYRCESNPIVAVPINLQRLSERRLSLQRVRVRMIKISVSFTCSFVISEGGRYLMFAYGSRIPLMKGILLSMIMLMFFCISVENGTKLNLFSVCIR